MDFFKKTYEKMMNWAFDDENKDEQDFCKMCHTKCTDLCECRCHITSCSKCDQESCDYKKCRCTCHGTTIVNEKVTETKNQAPPQFAQYSPIEPSLSMSLSKSPPRTGNFYSPKIDQDLKPSQANFSSPKIDEKTSQIKKNITFVNKLKTRYTNLKNEAKIVKQNKEKNSLVLNRSNSPLIKFKSRRKPLQDLNLTKDKSLNKSVEKERNNSTNTSRSFNVNENIFVANEIKRVIENKKFKDLSKSILKPKATIKNQNSISSPITPSQRDKNYLNHSFDLNNSELYHGKSSIVKRMEDLQRNILEVKKRDKDQQVKSIRTGFESQEAWQMYNSLIFANPLDLPDPDLLVCDEDYDFNDSSTKQKQIIPSFSKKS